MLKVAVLIV